MGGKIQPGRLPGGMASPPLRGPELKRHTAAAAAAISPGSQWQQGNTQPQDVTVLAILGTVMWLPAPCQCQAKAEPKRQSTPHLHHDMH